ncbi:putative inactive purple acid phosphatase 24 [Orobanche minor]
MKSNQFLSQVVLLLFSLQLSVNWVAVLACPATGEQPLSKIAIEETTLALRDLISVKASPHVLGLKGEDTEWIFLEIENDNPSNDDWVGVFSPAKFNYITNEMNVGWRFSRSICYMENQPKEQAPYICTAPVKYQFANFSNSDYSKTGKASTRLQLINTFPLRCLEVDYQTPQLMAVSKSISFANPKAPLYPRLAQGKSWNERPPARTVGWRDPGFIHTSFLKDLWPNAEDTYKMGHILSNGSYIWSKTYSFRSSPYPGQDSVQHVIIFGDMGKAERDGSNEYTNYQPGSLNTTDQLIKDLKNINIVFHIGDIAYANGYISPWDQFTAQVEPIASTVPYMVASGNHERDWPGSGSFYDTPDSGGECGVPAETMFYVPAENRAKFWYTTDYGMFHFCVADSEHDWREGWEQYKFIEHCLAAVDRQKQHWLIFAAHRVLGYSSDKYYGLEGSFEEPMGRERLQSLWQKYTVDLAFYGHVHN